MLHQAPNAMKRIQGLVRAFPIWELGCSEIWTQVPAFDGHMRVKTLVQENRIHIGTWNIGSLTWKLM